MNPCLTAINFVLVLLLWGSTAHALPSLQPKLRDKEIRVGLVGNSYLTPSSETISDSRTGNLSANIAVRGVGNKDNLYFGVEGESLYGLGAANLHYLNIAEAYLGYKPNNGPFSFFAGRKRYSWSNLDSYWSLGLYQPRFRWDYLNEKENGLVGLFTGYQTETFSAVAFYSPLFVPEQGAPFDISSGACKSASPWFSCPASSIFLFNQQTDVRFKLEVPPVKSIVLHQAAGGTIRLGREFGPFGRLSYTHKPINQFLLSFEGQLSISTLDVPAIIRPRVLYHDLYGADAGWNFDRHSIVASAIAERPIRDVTPANWNTQEPAKADLVGLTAKTMPFSQSFKYTRFEFAYLHRNGGNSPDRGPFVNPNVATFEPRYAFKNAYSAAVFTPIADSWARSFLFSTKLIYDSLNEGNILITDAFYRPTGSLLLNLGCDILGSQSHRPEDFISRYQRNDRVRGAVTYAF
ncbi:MAG: hypothetical protein ACXWQO_11745 [Bdellovibrionota bacterium]